MHREMLFQTQHSIPSIVDNHFSFMILITPRLRSMSGFCLHTQDSSLRRCNITTAKIQQSMIDIPFCFENNYPKVEGIILILNITYWIYLKIWINQFIIIN